MSDMGLPMTRRNLNRRREVPIRPLIALDARLAIEHLSVRSQDYTRACEERPDSPHVVTWRSFATLLAGEARTLAAAVHGSLEAIEKAGVKFQ